MSIAVASNFYDQSRSFEFVYESRNALNIFDFRMFVNQSLLNVSTDLDTIWKTGRP